MYDLHLSLHAEEDIVEIFAFTFNKFGAAALRRYEHLLTVALERLAENPLRPGSIARPEFGKSLRTYHLRFSRQEARIAEGTVQRPRHLIVYRILNAQQIEIVRLLHDSMELDRHLPRAVDDI